jgi:hypothetical protein
MKQYWAAKQRWWGAVLLMRVGSFYEAFDDDARIVQSVLGWNFTGTSRLVGHGAVGGLLARAPFVNRFSQNRCLLACL